MLNIPPLGNFPDLVIVGVGEPVAVTTNVPADPTVNVVLARLVIIGPWFTVSVKFAVVVPTLFVAVKEMGKLPVVPAAAVPPRIPVTLFSVMPLGSAPLSVNNGAG